MRIERSPCRRSTTSPLIRARRAAVAGEISAALSQVSFVSGFGSSCSHALLAKRPSWTPGSGRKTTSSPSADCGPRRRLRPRFPCTATVRVGNAVSGMRPSCSHLRHSRSNGDSGGTGAAAIGGGAGAAAGPVRAGAAAAAAAGGRSAAVRFARRQPVRGAGAAGAAAPASTAPSRATSTRARPRSPTARDRAIAATTSCADLPS